MRDCLHLEKQVYSKTLCYPTPHVKTQVSEIKFSLWTHFFTSRTSFLIKTFFTVKHFVTLPPMWKLSCQKSSFHFGLIFSHLWLPFSQKSFSCVKIQYLSSIYLWIIVSILKNKFTVKHFVTLLPMWKLSCLKSSFHFGLIFSHLGLCFKQKRFLCVKIQYLSSIYLWEIVSIMKNKFTVKHFVTLPPMWNLSCLKSSFHFGLIFLHLEHPF